MTASTITARLAGGAVRQHFYAEATAVEECQDINHICTWDTDCCYGLICEWNKCIPA